MNKRRHTIQLLDCLRRYLLPRQGKIINKKSQRNGKDFYRSVQVYSFDKSLVVNANRLSRYGCIAPVLSTSRNSAKTPCELRTFNYVNTFCLSALVNEILHKKISAEYDHFRDKLNMPPKPDLGACQCFDLFPYTRLALFKQLA